MNSADYEALVFSLLNPRVSDLVRLLNSKFELFSALVSPSKHRRLIVSHISPRTEYVLFEQQVALAFSLSKLY